MIRSPRKRRMLEIEEHYGIDSIRELDLWEREFNIPPTEVASSSITTEADTWFKDSGASSPPGTRSWRKSLHLQRQVWKLAVKPLFKIPLSKGAVWYRPAEAFYAAELIRQTARSSAKERFNGY
jgi:hypothetical protein